MEYDFTEEEIFINLKVISRLKPGLKLVVQNNLLNIDNTLFQTVVRWLYGAGRTVSIEFIERVVTKAFEFNERVVTSDDKAKDPLTSECRNHTIIRLTTDLNNCIDGLNNLKQTYSSDSLVSSRIDYVVDKIKVRTTNNSKLLEIPKAGHS